jgi:hypothetical protein
VPNGKRAASALIEQIKKSGITIFQARISRTTECEIYAGSTFILGIGEHRVHEDIMKFCSERDREVEPKNKIPTLNGRRSARYPSAPAGAARLSPPAKLDSSRRELHLL